MNKTSKNLYIKVPPELVDGDHYSVAGPGAEAVGMVADWVASWLEENAEAGETITLEVIELSDEEFEAIPEI